MRAWLYDWLTTDEALQADLGGTLDSAKARITPRRAQESILLPKPFIVYGLGNSTSEQLAEANDHDAERQFFQIWIHDEGGDYGLIDSMVEKVKTRLDGAQHPPSKVTLVRYLETSAEFSNETYNTLFRYIRFQAIISKGRIAA